MESENHELRKRLQEINERHKCEEVGCQIEKVAELSKLYPHSIRIIGEAIPDERETFGFTCFQHAFDLIGSKRIAEVASVYTKVYPSPDFVQYLIDHYLNELSPGAVNDGDVIVYAQGIEIKHAGIVIGNRVLSKWGLMHLWSHGTFEVPSRYGSRIRYFQRISRQRCIEAFGVYARERVREIYGKEL